MNIFLSFPYGNTNKDLMDLDKSDIYFGMSEEDKNKALMFLIQKVKELKRHFVLQSDGVLVNTTPIYTDNRRLTKALNDIEILSKEAPMIDSEYALRVLDVINELKESEDK